MVYTDPNGAVLAFNPAALDLLGMQEDQLRGISNRDPRWRMVGEDGEALPVDQRPVQQVFSTKAAIHFSLIGVFRPAREDWVWLRVEGAPLRDAAGDIVEVVLSFVDVTSERALATSLRAERNRTASLIAAVPDFMFEVDHERRLLWFHSPNDRLAPANWTYGHRIDAWIPPAGVQTIREALEEAKVEGHSFGRQLRIETPSGVRDRELSVSRMPNAGGEPTFLLLSRDVTARKTAERRVDESRALLEAVLDGVQDQIAAVDTECRLTVVNRAARDAFRALFGGELTVGTVTASQMGAYPDAQERLAGLWRRALAGEDFELPLEYPDRQGRSHSFRRRYSPLRAADGRIFGAAFVTREETARVEMERATTAALASAEMRVAALERLKRLEGLIRICSYCHRIHSDASDWTRLETYITSHSDAKFTHGICPTCFEEQMRLIDSPLPPDPDAQKG